MARRGRTGQVLLIEQVGLPSTGSGGSTAVRSCASSARAGARDARRPHPRSGRGATARADGPDGCAASPERLTFDEVGPALSAAPRGRDAAQANDGAGLPDHAAPPPRPRSSAATASTELEPGEIDAYIAAKRREWACHQDDHEPPQLRPRRLRLRDRRGWVSDQPVAMTDRPPSPPASRHPLPRPRGARGTAARRRPTTTRSADRVLWLTAATTGLRQGELAALRWRDVDWTAGLIRVRRSYSRGQYTTPKSRRASRAVPMADRVAGELERHFRVRVHRRRRPRSSATPTRGGRTTRARAAFASSRRFERAGSATASLPRPAPHLRDADGRRRDAATDAPGWMGHRTTRRRRSTPTSRPIQPGRGMGGARVRRRTDGRSVCAWWGESVGRLKGRCSRRGCCVAWQPSVWVSRCDVSHPRPKQCCTARFHPYGMTSRGARSLRFSA